MGGMEGSHLERIEHNGVLLQAHLVFPRELLALGVRSTAKRIAAWHGGRLEPLEILCILNGARRFVSDLAQSLAVHGVKTTVHFIHITSTDGAKATGAARLQGDFHPELLKGKRVLIADDIVDTGATMAVVRRLAEAAGAAEVKLAAVINKYADKSGTADFVVHDLKFTHEQMINEDGKKVDYWLFGYGMDLGGRFRELDHLAWVAVER